MRWKRKKKKNKFVWHRWYAWRPVKTDADDTWVWLEWIERERSEDFWWYRFPQREVQIAGSLLDALRGTDVQS